MLHTVNVMGDGRAVGVRGSDVWDLKALTEINTVQLETRYDNDAFIVALALFWLCFHKEPICFRLKRLNLSFNFPLYFSPTWI